MPGSVSCLSVTVLLTVCFLAIHDVQGQYKRVCYFTSWAQYRVGEGRFTTADVDANLCTHIIYSFFKFNRTTFAMMVDEWNTGTMLTSLLSLRNSNPDLKILIAVGGFTFGSGPFSAMASTREERQAFISSVLTTLSQYNVHGLDLDWEYPGSRAGSSPQDLQNFILLCKELNEAFQAQSPPYLLTAAVPAGYPTIEAGYNGSFAQYLDFVNVMAYDYNGNWNAVTGFNAPMYAISGDADMRFSVTETLKIYNQKQGIPRSKLVVGMPTFGRSWTLTTTQTTVHSPGSAGPAFNYTRTAGQLSYYEVCKQKPFTRVWDETAQVPYVVIGNTWISYDDVESLGIKTQFVMDGGYGGVMFWVLDYDDFKGMCGEGKFPLITAVKNKLLQAEGGNPTTAPTTTPTTTSTTTAPTTTIPTTTTTTPTTTTPTTTTPTTTPTTTTPTTTPTTTTTTTVRTTQPADIDCASKTDMDYARRFGFYADVMDCQKFYFCFPWAGFQWCDKVYSCKSGYLFDVYSLSCQPEATVSCVCRATLL